MSDEAVEDTHDAYSLSNFYEDILGITVGFVSELGATSMDVSELLKLGVGSVIDLEKPTGKGVELCISERAFGKGEAMIYEENLAIRINEVLDSETVLQYFKKEI